VKQLFREGTENKATAFHGTRTYPADGFCNVLIE
jgi:hypothetical protein